MQLTVKDISKLLSVSERTIYRWIKDNAIPAYRIHDQYRFNRAEILEWATANKIGVSYEIFQEPDDKDIDVPKLTEALKKGGIHYRVSGKDKESVLRSVIDILNLPDDVDREFLLKVILAREELGSTGIGEGIAIPHARNPIVLYVPCAVVALCFLEKAIDFGALDGKPVNCLFMLISPTVRVHLKIISQIAFALKNQAVKETILKQGSREVILNGIHRVEQSFKK